MIKKIKHIIVGIALIGMSLLGIPSSQAIDVIMGVTGACPTSNANCFPFPGSASAVCTAVLNQATCPRLFHPSWSNGNQLWGVSGTNAAACVRSIDAGAIWAACTAQAFVPIQQNIAETSDGTLVAVADVGGTCTFRTSPDNAATWNTVFTNPGVACGLGTPAQTLYCQSTGGQCDFGFGNGATSRTYRSTNNGANWTVSTIGDVQQSINHNIEMSGPLIGGFGGSLTTGQKATYESAGLFAVSAGWPGSAASYFASYAFMFGSVVQYISNDNGTNVWKRTDVDGNVLQSITPIGSQGIGAVANVGLRPLNWSGGIYYLVGGSTTGISVWVSTDSMVSTVELFSRAANPAPSSTRWTMYKVGSRVLISGNDGGTTGFFLRIS